MITWESINEANKGIKTVPIKNKEYACVPERIAAFRKVCPNGCITTDIVSLENGLVIMKATVLDEDGRVLATGMAFEREDASFINKTSYIENCETSAVGRALGMMGFGVDVSVASAEEVTNAINNQKNDEKPPVDTSRWILDDNQVGEIINLCKVANVNPEEIKQKCNVFDLHEMSRSQYVGYTQWMRKVIAGSNGD